MEVERMDKIAAEVRASLTNTTIDDVNFHYFISK